MRCSRARELISLYVAPNGPWLSRQDRQALEAHLAVCEPCRRDCQESRAAIRILRECWPISADTVAILERGDQQERHGGATRIITLFRASRRVAAWSVAACLMIGVFAGWSFLHRESPRPEPGRSSALSAAGLPLTIELADGSRISPGVSIQTADGERKRLVLNRRHQLLMNGSTRLSIEPLTEMERDGCQVNLALGEVYVHVEHDGKPFIVQTPHGRAVITGTTFEVRATQAGTTLVVVEGSVRFESRAAATQVVAGQQSRITGPSNVPSAPIPCDARSLTAWARRDHDAAEVAGPVPFDSVLRNDPLVTLSWPEAQIDLDRIDYDRWIEQKREWYRRQFPWVFALKEALAEEGVEADYPELLMHSGEIWRFAFPQAGPQSDPHPRGLLAAASFYGRNESWVRRQMLMPAPAASTREQPDPLEAFEQWTGAVEAYVDSCSSKAVSQVLWDTANAGLYLLNTRTLAILELRRDTLDPAPPGRTEALDVLQEQLWRLDACVRLSWELSQFGPGSSTCDDADSLKTLAREIRAIGKLQAQLNGYEVVLHL